MIDKINIASRNWAEDYITQNSRRFNNMLRDSFITGFKKGVELSHKRGKWVDKSGGIEGAWNYCSVCGEQAIDLYDFCPNCGADMRQERTES